MASCITVIITKAKKKCCVSGNSTDPDFYSPTQAGEFLSVSCILLCIFHIKS